MIVPRLRSEARGGSGGGGGNASSSTSSSRYNSGVYGGRIHHSNDPDLKRAIQYSYTSQAVRKWEKRWVTIHETSMRVHKWMPVPVSAPTHASQTATDKSTIISKKTKNEQQQQQQQLDSIPISTQDTQMLIDDDSTNQSSQN